MSTFIALHVAFVGGHYCDNKERHYSYGLHSGRDWSDWVGNCLEASFASVFAPIVLLNYIDEAK